MKMTITEYWNSLGEMQPNGLHKVLPEYEKKSSLTYKESGWNSVDEFRKQAKHKHKFIGEVSPGVFRFDGSKGYGIHSYQDITLSE